mgnify:CR=1 FL=1
MSTEETLSKLIDYADSALDHVNEQTALLFSCLHASSLEMKYSISPEIKDIIKTIKDYGVVYDSATYIKNEIDVYDDKSIIEMPLSNIDRDIDNLNCILQDVINELEVNNKSFVYIAWKKRPEEYYYVGKAKTSSRINLSSHGNLLESLKKATYFSLLFPEKATQEVNSNLEAALINLIEYKTGDLPIYNKRKELFSNNLDCAKELNDISNLFNKLSLQFKK